MTVRHKPTAAKPAGMNRFALPLVAFALLVVMFGVALKRAPDKQFVKSALIGKPAPEFVLPDLLQEGQTVSSRAFAGRWTLLNVWGTWCGECRAEHATLLQIRQEGKVADGRPQLQGRGRRGT